VVDPDAGLQADTQENHRLPELLTVPNMKISGNVLVGTILFLVLVIVIGPFISFGLQYKGNRYEIPVIEASSSVQQQP